jgi:hypothetical protein
METALLAMAMLGMLIRQQPLPFDRGFIGKPPVVPGLPLLPAEAWRVDGAGREAPATLSSLEVAAEEHAGYPSAGIGPGASLRWRLPARAQGKFYIYFLVRTGHQRGYECVYPQMTYFAAVDQAPLALEPAYELPAVRVYQSRDSWGHDMGWIRTPQPLSLQAGQQLTIGCVERYAHVSLVVVVPAEQHRAALEFAKSQGVGEAIRTRPSQARLLADRIADVFPQAAGACAAARQKWQAVESAAARLEADAARAAEALRRGEAVDPRPFLAQAEALQQPMATAERATCALLAGALARVQKSLEARAQRVRVSAPADFAGREAQYAWGVAARYLAAARGGPRDLDDLRRWATYLWRAEQFLARAEAARKRAGPPARPPTPAAPALHPVPRIQVLLNGLWQMSTEGSPDQPPAGGWFAVPVPHGPWHETIGNFMALDRQWPAGQSWAWYRTRFLVPAQMAGARIFLRFEAVFHLCEAYVNGAFVGRHIGGFDDFEFEVTDHVKPGEEAELLCFVHDTSYTALPKSELRRGEPEGCSSGPNYYAISDLWGGAVWGHLAGCVAGGAARGVDGHGTNLALVSTAQADSADLGAGDGRA